MGRFDCGADHGQVLKACGCASQWQAPCLLGEGEAPVMQTKSLGLQ